MTQEIPMNIRLIGAAAMIAELASAGCATTSHGYGGGYGSGSGYGSAPASCYDCGTVTRIEQGSGSRVPNATGAVIGGVLGAAAAGEMGQDRTSGGGRREP